RSAVIPLSRRVAQPRSLPAVRLDAPEPPGRALDEPCGALAVPPARPEGARHGAAAGYNCLGVRCSPFGDGGPDRHALGASGLRRPPEPRLRAPRPVPGFG